MLYLFTRFTAHLHASLACGRALLFSQLPDWEIVVVVRMIENVKIVIQSEK